MITLSASEMLLAAQAGVMRTVENLVRGNHGAHGSAADDWSMSIEGALAEWAAAKALGINWPGKGKMRGPDAGNLQIRSTRNPKGCLMLHPSDEDGAVFVLMIGQANEWIPAGWIRAEDGKQKQWWRTDIRSPAYLVPQPELKSMVDLVG
jgi:hypothetical protein